MTASSVDYAKLTVPQLKALCKERKLSGYSKLGKAALVEKLAVSNGRDTAVNVPSVDHGNFKKGAIDKIAGNPGAEAVIPVASFHLNGKVGTQIARSASQDQSTLAGTANFNTRATISALPPVIATTRKTPDIDGNISGTLELPVIAEDQTREHIITTPCIAASSSGSSAMPPPSIIPGPLRAASKRYAASIAESPSKRAKSYSFSRPIPPSSSTPLASSVDGSSGVPGLVTKSPDKTGLGKENTTRAVPNTVLGGATTTGKRFRPLVINKKLAEPAAQTFKLLPSVDAHLTSSACGVSCDVSPGWDAQVSTGQETVVRYLEFPALSSVPELVSISLPPPLVHRKRVQRWAIILSQVDKEGCRSCVLVSKMLRYAVYLSAQYRLTHDFAGRRTTHVLAKYPPSTTNFWPYLRFRQREISVRRSAYMHSFLASAIQKCTSRPPDSAICERVWGSPDHEHQLIIALRYLLTLFWFTVSVGGAKSGDWLRCRILNVQEVVPGEIWSVSFMPSNGGNDLNSHSISTVYVIEATCEVVGTSSPTSSSQHGGVLPPLRADWSAYVSVSLQTAGVYPVTLLSQLKWAHQEEYDRGLSHAWLMRISQEGDIGAEKRRVAERYVLACVISNSVSGKWMSAIDMAQESAGMPSKYGLFTSKAHSQQRVNLYLPAHHHVESIHFTTSTGVPLHPALAVVQTLDREYFILKDNGMEVGCEEEGVSPLWMEILNCDTRGLRK